MNRDEQFEQRLLRQPLREIPSTWREEILDAASSAAGSRPSTFDPRPAPWWRELFWPHPTAWAALAAVWLVVLGLNFVSREPSSRTLARQVAPPSPQMRELLKQQERLFAELVGPIEKPQADRSKLTGPQPRSSRRVEFINA